MIYNKNLGRLIELQVVKEFMRHQNFRAVTCDEIPCFILYRFPYVVEFRDALIENYLEIILSDLSEGALMQEGDLIWCSVSLGNQSREKLKNMNFENHHDNSIFISSGAEKMYGLHTCLEAIDKLLPLIEVKGGLASIRDGEFGQNFEFDGLVKPMWHGMKERYLRCIGEGGFQP